MSIDSTLERSIPVQTKLYYDVQLSSQSPAPLLIALHGYGANKGQMMREAKHMTPEGFAVASLQGPHQHLRDAKEAGGPLRFGFGWLTNFRADESVALHHQALLHLIDTLVAERVADPARIFLLGFSQSCALNYRFAFTHTNRLRGVIGICGGIPSDWNTSEDYKETDAAIFHLAGLHDEFYPPARVADYEKQLNGRARRVVFRSYDAAHEIVSAMRDDVRQWLSEHV